MIRLANKHFETVDSYDIINIIVSWTNRTIPKYSHLHEKQGKYRIVPFEHSFLNYCKNDLLPNMCKNQRSLLLKSVKLWARFNSRFQWPKSRTNKLRTKNWTSLPGTHLERYYLRSSFVILTIPPSFIDSTWWRQLLIKSKSRNKSGSMVKR